MTKHDGGVVSAESHSLLSGERPAPGSIPTNPGVYRFRDPSGRVIYVGKARNLRARLSSYFADPRTLHPRTSAMVAAAASVDWLIVGTETEALSLEYVWIKEFDPRFNVRYRDDKSYPFLAVTMDEEFPRVSVVRGVKRRGTRYFGPYAQAWAIRATLDELLKVFPMRSCRSGVFRRAQQQGRPCLLGYIDRCSAPCVGRVTAAEHLVIAEDLCTFMSHGGRGLIREFERRMRESAELERFEEAARLRDAAGALTRVMERNAVVLADGTDTDVIAMHEDALECGIQVIGVRDGRIGAEYGFVLEKTEDLDSSGYLERALQRIYGDPSTHIPREVLVSHRPPDETVWEGLLTNRRSATVSMRVPQRGDKRALMETALTNAEHLLRRHQAHRASDLTTRSRAIQEIQDALELPAAPLRIEGLDISTLQGQDTVASCVVFEDGLPKRREYRTYAITSVTSDDPAAIAEVVRRRFRAESPASAYPPGLLLIDGGAPQVNAATSALSELGLCIPVAGLAKRLEEVWLPESPDPVIMPRASEGLYLLQRVRDEAHRVAISFHRRRRTRRASGSALDSIAGLGPKRVAALLQAFGSVDRVRSASVEQIAAVPGIGPGLAATIHGVLGSAS